MPGGNSFDNMPTCVSLPQSSLLKLILGKLSASGSQRASYWHWCEQFLSRYGLGVLMHALCTRYCCCCKPSQAGDEDAVSSRPAVGSPPKVTCIIASFDAWLFSDSDVLWAVMISEIFQKVGALPDCDIQVPYSNDAVCRMHCATLLHRHHDSNFHR